MQSNHFNYNFFDAYGLCIGVLAFIVVFFIAYFLLKKHDSARRSILYIVFASIIGHFIGALANYWYSISFGSDSVDYFRHAYRGSGVFGYYFAMHVLDILKKYILGDSLLGAFFICGAIGFLSSVYYFLTYKVLLDKVVGQQQNYFPDSKQLFLPAILLLCWPSYFYWSAGLVKDSFSFLAISMILYATASGKVTLFNLITFIVGFFLVLLARPYLLIIFMISFLIYIFFNSKWNIALKIGVIFAMLIAFQILLPVLDEYRKIIHFTGSINDLASYAIRQQQYMNVGSSIPVPTHNAQLLFLFIPYLFLGNLLLPLEFVANNFRIILSSIENLGLLLLILFFFKNRPTWKILKNELSVIKYYFLYFTIGMICLSIMCTNLGLAMRQKSMYVPALLICICLVFSYKRMMLRK